MAIGLELQHQLFSMSSAWLPQVSNYSISSALVSCLPVHPEDLGLASLHNCITQFFKTDLFTHIHMHTHTHARAENTNPSVVAEHSPVCLYWINLKLQHKIFYDCQLFLSLFCKHIIINDWGAFISQQVLCLSEETEFRKRKRGRQ